MPCAKSPSRREAGQDIGRTKKSLSPVQEIHIASSYGGEKPEANRQEQTRHRHVSLHRPAASKQNEQHTPAAQQ